ncbi:tyrosine-type recombinase/integrase [Pseudomonas vranovensis]|uniref:tyrosine-type recombinase/integrase n=1 Tax=Pseudomonas vranovensis TaxID=321661 RepID=UPI003D963D2A
MQTLGNRQLHSLLGDFTFFDHFSVDRLSTCDASNMSFLCWPNGTPCLIGNLYLQSLLKSRGRTRNGLSRKGRKGGSMGDFAGKVAQLLRRCYRDKIDLINLTDKNFRDYIIEIRQEKAEFNPAQNKKTENSVIATGRVWLDFLVFVGGFYRNKNFVSPSGMIRAREETYIIKVRGGRNVSRSYLTHHSFGRPHREHHRDPITNDQIKLLKAANRKDKAPDFVKMRRHVMIELFTDLGPRRGELANLRVEDVRNALKMETPVLRLDTLKREEGAERYVAIFMPTLQKIDQFIDGDRRKLMRKVYKGGRDHGFVFVSSRTGKPLSAAVFSNEILALRKLAGIESQVCTHMFRHAMITRVFTHFISRHELNNADDFRRALLDTKTFLAEVVSWTGHLDPKSVEYYINLAFRNLSNYTETLTSAHLTMAMDKYFQLEEELLERLEEGMPVAEYKKKLKALKELAQKDFEISEKRESSLRSS